MNLALSDEQVFLREAARGLAQEDLLVGERQVHAAAPSLERSSENGIPLSRRGAGGSPRTRSPIVLRRISSVPPADFRPGRNEIMYAHSLFSLSASGPTMSAITSPALMAALTIVTFASPASGPGTCPRCSAVSVR